MALAEQGDKDRLRLCLTDDHLLYFCHDLRFLPAHLLDLGDLTVVHLLLSCYFHVSPTS
jgi:hypothetical protein